MSRYNKLKSTSKTSMKDISQVIKKLRENAGISLTELANASSLSLAYISKLEGGEYKNLKLTTSKSLADGLGLSLRDFLGEIDILTEHRKPAMQIVAQALRKDGYTNKDVEEIIEYARFKKKYGNK